MTCAITHVHDATRQLCSNLDPSATCRCVNSHNALLSLMSDVVGNVCRPISIIASGKHHDNCKHVKSIMDSVVNMYGGDVVWELDLTRYVPNPAGGKKERVFQKTDASNESTVIGVFSNPEFPELIVKLLTDVAASREL